VNHTVRSVDIGRGHLSVVDVNTAAEDVGFDVLALNSLDLLVIFEVLGMHGPGGNVVGEYVVELLDVLRVEQVSECGSGKFAEGLVGGREHGEGTSTGEGVDELAGLEGSDESGKVGGGDGEVNDGLGGGARSRAGARRGKKHRVDDVNHTICSEDVGGDDLRDTASGVNDDTASAGDVGLQIVSLQGRNQLCVRDVPS